MKYFAALAFVCFMGISVYVLLNEKNVHPKVSPRVAYKSRAKKIGERTRDDQPYELQRQRIDSTTIYKFESKTNKEDNYELDEDELSEFTNQMNNFSAVKKAGTIEYEPTFDINTVKEKEYYE